MIGLPPRSTLFPYPTLFRSGVRARRTSGDRSNRCIRTKLIAAGPPAGAINFVRMHLFDRSEEHTSELQSRPHLACRPLLGKNAQAKRRLLTSPVRHYALRLY